MKKFNGKFGRKRWYSQRKSTRELLEWAGTRKPGDIFSACDGYNHVIKEIIPLYEHKLHLSNEFGFLEIFGDSCTENRLDKTSHWIIREFQFNNEDGSTFICPGGGCAVPPFTAQMIREQFPGFNCDERGIRIL